VDNHEFDQPSDQFVLSQELVQLMEWIVEHEADSLKKVIAHALAKGSRIRKEKKEQFAYSQEDLQNSVIDFFSLMELLMIEITNEHDVSHIIQKNILPAINHVDSSACDYTTIQSCATAATNKIERKPEQNVKELFLKELLKRWKPNSTENAN